MTSMDGFDQSEPIRRLRPAASSGVEAASRRQGVSAGGNAAPAPEPQAAPRLAVIEAADTITSLVQNVSRELRFAVDSGTGRTVITVLDRATGQVIRQIPEEELLALARHLEEVSAGESRGLIFDGEA